MTTCNRPKETRIEDREEFAQPVACKFDKHTSTERIEEDDRGSIGSASGGSQDLIIRKEMTWSVNRS
jgi:hypothetical protein